MKALFLGSAAVIASALLISTAKAWNPPPGTDEQRAAVYLPIARAAWPDSPCLDRETVHLNADDALALLDTTDGVHAVGRADPETCEVWIAGHLDPAVMCSTLVHELGHLAGMQHTNDGSVMDPDGVFFPCLAAIYPPPGDMRAKATWGIWQSLPQTVQRRGSVYCGVLRCVVTGTGLRVRRYQYEPSSGLWWGPSYR